MFFSKKLQKFKNIKHCFFSRKNGVSKGIYESLNCGIGSKDQEENVKKNLDIVSKKFNICLLYTSPSPRDLSTSRMPSSA